MSRIWTLAGKDLLPIGYYEGADPILPNVPTYLCWRPEDRTRIEAPKTVRDGSMLSR